MVRSLPLVLLAVAACKPAPGIPTTDPDGATSAAAQGGDEATKEATSI